MYKIQQKFLLKFLIMLILYQSIYSYARPIKETEVRIIPKDSSLDIIRNIIMTTPVQYFKIAVFFDFDDTLTHTEGYLFKKTYLRGGDSTRKLIDFLNTHKIPWFINTANGFGPFGIKPTAHLVKELGLEIPSWLSSDCFQKKSLKFVPQKNVYKGTTIQYCDNIVSAGFKKERATEFILNNIRPYPELIIFVDDNPQNILNMYDYFSVGAGKIYNTHFIGMVYESPYFDDEESKAALKKIKNLIQKHKNLPLEYRQKEGLLKHLKSLFHHIFPFV